MEHGLKTRIYPSNPLAIQYVEGNAVEPKTQRTWFRFVYHSALRLEDQLDICLSPGEQSKSFNLGLSSNALDNYGGGCRGQVLGKNNTAASSMMQSLMLVPLLCSYTKSLIEGLLLVTRGADTLGQGFCVC